MADLNPFPDYPVVHLKAEVSTFQIATIITPAIEAAHALVDGYASQWFKRQDDKNQQIEAIITAVRGDYGMGKTHLLLDSASRLQSKLTSAFPDLKIMRFACLELDPVNWFKLSIGPEFKRPITPTQTEAKPGFIERLMLRLYASAGQKVASRTKLTEGAIERLAREPEAIRTLLKDNLLNVSAVDEELDLLLQKCCPYVSQNVRTALAGTVWSDTSERALRWLAGDPLSDSDRNAIRVTKDLSDEEDAAGVLLALAAVHKVFDTPFVLMIDELEHLTRYDRSQQSNRNITWLKRLIEGLAAHQTLTFVSGHWSAWETQRDYLDRFTQLRSIELVKLSTTDVLKIVRKRVPALSSTPELFGEPQAKAVAESVGGNTRRVLTLCRLLFRQTNGFRTTLTAEQIQEAAGQLGQRITPEDAALRVRSIMEQEGLTVRSQSATVTGIVFDLIGYQRNQIRVVVDVKHAVHQADQNDQAKVFLDRVQEVYQTAPDIIGCFIADGNVDDDLLQLLNATRSFKLLWYDLTTPDVLTRLVTDLRSSLHGGIGSDLNQDVRAAELSARKNQNEELVIQLEERIKAASATANAGLVDQLREQRHGVELQLNELNRQLAVREAELREEFLKNLKAQVEELDQKRSGELQQLYARLENERRQSQSLRDEEVLRKQEGEEMPKLHATYTELIRPPSFSKKLRLALSNAQLLLTFFSCAVGLMLIVMSDGLARFTSHDEYVYNMNRIIFYGSGSLLTLSAVLMIWLRLTKVEAFFDYSARTLREIYIRSKSVEDLVRVDSILRDCLETLGPVWWKKVAEDRLREEFGPMLSRSSMG